MAGTKPAMGKTIATRRLLGGDHRRPYQGDPGRSKAARAVARVTLDFLDLYLRGDAAATGRLTQDGTVSNVARLERAT